MEGKKSSGWRELRKHENGDRLTKNQMCKAKCYECMCGYIDGRLDCKIEECPLYPQMPYRDKVKYSFLSSRALKKLSPERIKLMVDGRTRAKAEMKGKIK